MTENNHKMNPFDYSDSKCWVYFELADKENGIGTLNSLSFLDKPNIIEVPFGFKLLIANQHIPEVIRSLAMNNIAIYEVVRQSN